MIKKIDDQWTTVQCKNLDERNGRVCNLCFKVLNDRFALTQQCPYCLGKIDLRPWVKDIPEPAAAAKQFPRVRKEDTVGFQQDHAASKEDAGTRLWDESTAAPKRHIIREDG